MKSAVCETIRSDDLGRDDRETKGLVARKSTNLYTCLQGNTVWSLPHEMTGLSDCNIRQTQCLIGGMVNPSTLCRSYSTCKVDRGTEIASTRKSNQESRRGSEVRRLRCPRPTSSFSPHSHIGASVASERNPPQIVRSWPSPAQTKERPTKDRIARRTWQPGRWIHHGIRLRQPGYL